MFDSRLTTELWPIQWNEAEYLIFEMFDQKSLYLYLEENVTESIKLLKLTLSQQIEAFLNLSSLTKLQNLKTLPNLPRNRALFLFFFFFFKFYLSSKMNNFNSQISADTASSQNGLICWVVVVLSKYSFNFTFIHHVAFASPFVSLLSHSLHQKKEIQTTNQNRSRKLSFVNQTWDKR